MAAAVGRSIGLVSEKPAEEVVVAEERHLLSVGGEPQELRVVLSRPLVQPRDAALLQVRRLKWQCACSFCKPVVIAWATAQAWN